MMRIKLCSLILWVSCWILPAQATQHVVTNNNDSGTGSLRQVLLATANNDTIVFAPSLIGDTILLISGQLLFDTYPNTVKKKITVIGPGADHLAIDGGGIVRHFQVDLYDTLILHNLSFINGGGRIIPDTISLTGGSITATQAGLYGYDCKFINNYSATDTANGLRHGGNGGVAALLSSKVVFSNCQFINNYCTGLTYFDQFPRRYGTGGGVFYTNRTDLLLKDCLFQGNQAEQGGVINNRADAQFIIDGCTFDHNMAPTFQDTTLGLLKTGQGGAIFSFGSNGHDVEWQINNCSFTNNQATIGGAIYSLTGSNGGTWWNITNTTLANNIAFVLHDPTDPQVAFGGAIYNQNTAGNSAGVFNLTNCTLSGNAVFGGMGGGYYGLNGPNPGTSGTVELHLQHTTITNNYAIAYSTGGTFYTADGSALCLQNKGAPKKSILVMENSIIAENPHSPLPQVYIDSMALDSSKGHNLIGVYRGFHFTPTTGDIIGDALPVFAGLDTLQYLGAVGPVHPLTEHSLCRDAGNPADTLSTDQVNNPRPFNGITDIGAVELQTPAGPCNITAGFLVPDSMCTTDNYYRFTNTSVNARNYQWLVNSEVYTLYPEFYYQLPVSGTDTITLIAFDGSCSDTTQQVVSRAPGINLDILGNGTNDITTTEPVILNAGQASSYQWSTGDTTATIVAGSSGMYSVTVTNSAGCIFTDVVVVHMVSGLNETGFSQSVKIYPNPASTQINIQWQQALSGELMLYNLQGELLQQHQLHAQNDHTLDVSSLHSGMYLISIRSAQGTYSTRLVVE